MGSPAIPPVTGLTATRPQTAPGTRMNRLLFWTGSEILITTLPLANGAMPSHAREFDYAGLVLYHYQRPPPPPRIDCSKTRTLLVSSDTSSQSPPSFKWTSGTEAPPGVALLQTQVKPETQGMNPSILERHLSGRDVPRGYRGRFLGAPSSCQRCMCPCANQHGADSRRDLNGTVKQVSTSETRRARRTRRPPCPSSQQAPDTTRLRLDRRSGTNCHNDVKFAGYQCAAVFRIGGRSAVH